MAGATWAKRQLVKVLPIIAAFVAAYLAIGRPAYGQDCVFYVTDRQMRGHSFGNKRNYSKTNDGITYATVPVVGTRRHCDMKNIRLVSRQDFLSQLRSERNRLQTKEIAVFVHGYNQKPREVMSCGVALERALSEPVVVFDWPSIGKLNTYTFDECNVEWSLLHFELLMKTLIKEMDGAQNIMTVSHSLGNRLVYWYLQMRFDQAKEALSRLKEVVLTSPDIDRATFKNYFYKVAGNAGRVRVYVSNRDTSMWLSSLIHGGYKRLGAGHFDGSDDIRWKKPGNLGPHEPAEAETINFTALDRGWLGHTIQSRLIASMHNTNQPGAGLYLETAPDTHYLYVRRGPRKASSR
jgi:esterase/lipase superfamily enzyme